jgi:hypothetical protein
MRTTCSCRSLNTLKNTAVCSRRSPEAITSNPTSHGGALLPAQRVGVQQPLGIESDVLLCRVEVRDLEHDVHVRLRAHDAVDLPHPAGRHHLRRARQNRTQRLDLLDGPLHQLRHLPVPAAAAVQPQRPRKRLQPGPRRRRPRCRTRSPTPTSPASSSARRRTSWTRTRGRGRASASVGSRRRPPPRTCPPRRRNAPARSSPPACQACSP